MSPAGPHWWPAYIGIGSNLDSPVKQVRSAVSEMTLLPASTLTASSSLYRTAPMGPQDQPDFVNAVASVLTRLSADDLLTQLLGMEEAHGRKRHGQKWGARTLDLDLLVYGRKKIDSDNLIVPHPGIAQRNFVLLPLAEVAPHLQVPGLGSVADLLLALGDDSPEIEKIDFGNDGN